MGGLIRRKNRSMPDLTEGKGEENSSQLPPEKTMSSVDDSSVGLKGSEKISTMCGYLSEGHLEFTGNGNNANPNLERSRLMRKSFHGSAGKVLTVAKVPPPPPLRTTSQLSASKLTNGEVCQTTDRPPYPLPVEATNPSYYHHNHHHHPQVHQIYSNHSNVMHNNHHKNIAVNNRDFSVEPQSLPFLPLYNDKTPNCQSRETNQALYEANKRKFGAPDRLYNEHTVVTQADVHQEQSPMKDASYNEQYQMQVDSGVDEVDCVMPSSREPVLEELPPYPSPLTSVIHSRQASEEFPPPPSALDLSALDEQLKILRQTPSPKPTSTSSSLLSELQKKREQILSQERENKEQQRVESVRSSGDTWLRELQAKQAALKMKKNHDTEPKTQNSINTDSVNKVNNHLTNFAQDKTKQIPEISRDIPPTEAKVKSVKDLASRFEKVNVPNKCDSSKPLHTSTNGYLDVPPISIDSQQSSQNTDQLSISGARENSIETGVLSLNRRNSIHENHVIDPSQIEEEIKEVEMISACVKQGIHPDELEKKNKRNRNGKKKSVSFCDQVILVATAEDQEDDSYIPNPILERVLRSALNKPETAAIQQEIRSLREAELKKEASEHTQRNKSPVMIEEIQNIQTVAPQLSPNVQHYYNNTSAVYNHEPKEYATQNMVQVQREFNNTQTPIANMQNNGMVHENDLRQHHTQSQSYYPTNQNHNSSNIPLPECSPTSSTNSYPMHSYNGPQINPPHRQSIPQYVSPPQHSNPPHQYMHQNTYSPNSPLSPPQPDQYKHEQYQTHQMNQYNMNSNYNHINQPIRQSPVQTQSQQYPPYYHANHVQQSHQQQTVPPAQSNYHHVPSHSVQPYNQHPTNHHSPSPLTISQQHSQYVTKMQPQRSPMSPTGMPPHQPNYYPQQTNTVNNLLPPHQSPYQSVPLPADFQNTNHQRFPQSNGEVNNPPYQRVPPTLTNGGNHIMSQQDIGPYQHVPTKMNGDMNNLPYQRVPPTTIANRQNVMQQEMSPYQQVPTKYSPYQYALPPKQQMLQQKKSVHFEPGTKGGNESPTPKAIVSPIIVNNTQVNNSLNNKTKCNLCRKKHVASPELYCNDCEFYMSRFKPRTQ